MLSCTSPRRLAIGCLAALAAIALASPNPQPLDDGSASVTVRDVVADAKGPNPIPKLKITLRQTRTSPPTVRVGVTNRNNFPVTIVDYQSPLDSLALQTGMLTIIPEGASEPLQLPIIRVKRVWPPRDESLPVIRPGATAYNDLVLKEPPVPMDKLGKKARVILKGQWMAVWPRSRDQLSAQDIENAATTGFQGNFVTKPLQIHVE